MLAAFYFRINQPLSFTGRGIFERRECFRSKGAHMSGDGKYLSIKEFAELTGSSRATLVHYGDLGLLRPAVVKDNGYRFYLPDQAQDYLTILLFAECGLSLKEIAAYMDAAGARRGHAFINRALEGVDAKIRRLEQIRSYMLNKRSFYELSIEHTSGCPFLHRFGEGKFIASNVYGVAEQDKVHTGHAVGILSHLKEEGEFPDYPYMSRLRVEREPGGMLRCVPCALKEDTELEVECHPGGLYACSLHKGSELDVDAALGDLFTFVAEKGLESTGPVYLVDTTNFVISKEADEYQTLFHVRVRASS